MSTWTKADLRRMQAALDLAGAQAQRTNTFETTDEHRERVNVFLANNAVGFVRDHLNDLIHIGEMNPRLAPGPDDSVRARRRAEGRAAKRLLDRLATEPFPFDLLTIPRLTLMREIEAQIADEHAQQLARETPPPPTAPTYQSDPERDRRVIAHNLADLVSRGVVEVHRASADAFNTDTQWADVEQRVTWHEWARVTAAEHNSADLWDRCPTADTPKEERYPLADVPAHVFSSGMFWLFWFETCQRQPLPDVLDLRGAPESHGLLIESWVESLSIALHRSTRGIVILVDDNPDILARCLPSYTKGH